MRLTPPPFRVYCIRHGETDWNAEGRLQGQRDIGLNDTGRKQAEATGHILASIAPDAAALAYLSSPLSRTRETMERLRAAAGLQPPDAFSLDDRLKELAFGKWEGLTWKEVSARDQALASRRERDKWNTQPPQGESYAMLAERLAPLVGALSGPSVLVSHGGVMRTLMAMIGGLSAKDAAETFVHQGVVYVFEAGRFDKVTIPRPRS